MYGQIANFIKELGFPIGVAIYFMVMYRKTIAENTKAIVELTEYIKNCNGNFKKSNK